MSTGPTPSTIGHISGATGIDSGLKRTATGENLKAAGQQFESVFTSMMLKSMRQAKLADPLFDSQAIDTFRDMQDQKLVQQMAEHTPLGIGKAMTDFLARGLSATIAENQAGAENGAEPDPNLQSNLTTPRR
ncbi:rod-binding protein [Sphingomonas jeddahensis]|uniref:Peptidoglycan hydrolase FlgJ n=1 Tax=Sphingomonas jeddahensis TaxID=1915074 RepID=A0A1V2EWA4_9SPHN|nr:rod-binding protein [Sphingomonas jeddahensis]ONF96765.1 Peptidoglycan hydrolase FlgJ [Sphingomonas jeddahensis]